MRADGNVDFCPRLMARKRLKHKAVIDKEKILWGRKKPHSG